MHSGVKLIVMILKAVILAIACLVPLGDRISFGKPIEPFDFAHVLSRAQMAHLMKAAPVDSFFDFDAHGKSVQVLVFAPVHLAGMSTIANVTLLNDSVVRTDFYLPYRPRGQHKPVPPYGTGRFTSAQLDDLVRLRNTLTKLYGEPAVMAETTFLYFGGPSEPHMSAIFKDATVELSVFPS